MGFSPSDLGATYNTRGNWQRFYLCSKFVGHAFLREFLIGLHIRPQPVLAEAVKQWREIVVPSDAERFAENDGMVTDLDTVADTALGDSVRVAAQTGTAIYRRLLPVDEVEPIRRARGEQFGNRLRGAVKQVDSERSTVQDRLKRRARVAQTGQQRWRAQRHTAHRCAGHTTWYSQGVNSSDDRDSGWKATHHHSKPLGSDVLRFTAYHDRFVHDRETYCPIRTVIHTHLLCRFLNLSASKAYCCNVFPAIRHPLNSSVHVA